MFHGYCNCCFSVKWYSACYHFIHHDTERVNITLCIDVTASCPYLGVMLKDIPFKPHILVACISRMGKPIVPGGFDSFAEGDTVIIINSANRVILDLNDVFSAEA